MASRRALLGGLLGLLLLSAASASPLTLQCWFSYPHNDNVVLVTPEAVASLDPTYKLANLGLDIVSAAPGAGLVPLNLYSNAATHHHMTTASATGNQFALANGFQLVGVQGYVYATNPGGSTARQLEMWYGAARNDHFLVSTDEERDDASGAGYVLQYVDSWTSVVVDWMQWPSTPPADSPFPLSADLSNYFYASGGQAVPPGIHADTWYPSWAADGRLYSSWTDGKVDGIPSGSGGGAHATTGFAIIEGDDPFNLTLTGVATYVEPTAPYQGRYPSLNAHIDGVWYYGTYSLEDLNGKCGNWCIQGPFCSIRTSVDDGATWFAPRRNMTSWSDNIFGETAFNNSKVKYGAPHAVDHGQNNMHSPDGALYIIGHGGEGPASHQSWMQGDSVYMARTVGHPNPATINNASSWQFFAGGTGASAQWASSISEAKPLFVWPGRTGVVTLSYHPALSKYIMVVSTPTTGYSTVGNFDTYFLESDNMTGPWAMVAYLSAYGPEAYFVHVPSKWMGSSFEREEGAHAVGAANYSYLLSYSADFASGSPNPPGSGYHWSLQPSRFTLSAAFAAQRQAAAAAA